MGSYSKRTIDKAGNSYLEREDFVANFLTCFEVWSQSIQYIFFHSIYRLYKKSMHVYLLKYWPRLSIVDVTKS